MKKLMILLLFVLFALPAYSQTIDITAYYAEPTKKDNSQSKYIYTMPAVGTSTTQVFKINSDAKFGDILELSIRYPSSADYVVWISENESEADDPKTSIVKYTIDTFYFKPALPLTTYINRDLPTTNVIYVTIENNGAATGIGELVVVYGGGR